MGMGRRANPALPINDIASGRLPLKQNMGEGKRLRGCQRTDEEQRERNEAQHTAWRWHRGLVAVLRPVAAARFVDADLLHRPGHPVHPREVLDRERDRGGSECRAEGKRRLSYFRVFRHGIRRGGACGGLQGRTLALTLTRIAFSSWSSSFSRRCLRRVRGPPAIGSSRPRLTSATCGPPVQVRFRSKLAARGGALLVVRPCCTLSAARPCAPQAPRASPSPVRELLRKRRARFRAQGSGFGAWIFSWLRLAHFFPSLWAWPSSPLSASNSRSAACLVREGGLGLNPAGCGGWSAAGAGDSGRFRHAPFGVEPKALGWCASN